MPHVFLSYSRQDEALANQIDDLAKTKVEVWRDIHNLEGGELFEGRIKEAIGKARCLLLLLSPLSYNSSSVQKEVKYALENQIPIIPLLRGFRANTEPY
ncbi:MAG: toll/interleukin-1 receptor domain-containing protein [Rhodomicrobium sp.]